MSKPDGVLRRLWVTWKSLDLPWRKYRFAGADLQGTTYWEFKDALNPARARRIAQHAARVHYADVKPSPAWHQWLRHTRLDPPSIEEQQADVQRQIQLKQLAQLADQRWAEKGSYLDSPDKAQPAPATLPRDPGGYVGKEKEKRPFKEVRGGPSEKWQPESWTPGAVKR